MENKEKLGCPLQLAILLVIVSWSAAGATLFVGVDDMLTVSIVSLIAAIAAGIALQIHESNQHEDEPERGSLPGQGRASDENARSEGTFSSLRDTFSDCITKGVDFSKYI